MIFLLNNRGWLMAVAAVVLTLLAGESFPDASEWPMRDGKTYHQMKILYFATFGAILGPLDLLLRATARASPEVRGMRRWFGPFAGGHFYFVPLWIVAVVSLLIAFVILGSANFWWLTD